MQTNTQWETLKKNFTLESLVTLYLYRKRNQCRLTHFLYRFQTDRMYTITSQWCLFLHLFKKPVLVTQQHTKNVHIVKVLSVLESIRRQHLRVKHRYRFRAGNSPCPQIQISSENNLVSWCKNLSIFVSDPGFLVNPDQDPGFLVNSDQDPGFLVNRDPDTDFLRPKIHRPVEK